MTPFVSVIIPCRNEEKYIGQCLDSVIAQDFPKENLEVLVIDGTSGDKTKEVVKKYSDKHSFVKVLDNPQKFIPFALNIGIKNAKGEIIIRLDAHASYGKDYISKSLKYLTEYNADNVGGIIKTLPAKATLTAKSIAFCLSSFFGVGNSFFRRGSEKPREADTVLGGCYKKEIFEKIGLFNEKLLRSEDIELNKRLRKAGGKIILVPDIVAFYYPQADFKSFLRHNFTDGIWATYPLKFGVKIFSFRHLIPLFFVLGFLAGLILGLFSLWGKVIFVVIFGIYLLLSLFFSLKPAVKDDPRYLFSLPIAFFSRHFGYGLGSLWGLVKIII